jgi:class 3 adenylate cyclase
VQVPDVRYARSGDLRIAYQTWGEGPRLLYIADLISHVEVAWEHELYRRSLEHLGRYMTLAWFDKRGIGMSDRFDEAPTLDQRNQDILAVMDALGWERAHICGQSEGGIMAQLFAADFPERVESVTLTNTVAPSRYFDRLADHMRPDDPPPLNGAQIYAHFEQVLETWGEDATFQVAWELPSQAGNVSFERWMARLMRLAASPKDFKRQLDSVFALDAGDAPERISAPTMVMHVQGDRVLTVAMGRVLADVIPGAQFVEIDGADHFAWIMPNWREVTDIFIGFVTGKPVDRATSRSFATVLFTDIVDSTRQSASVGDARWREILDRHDRTARGLIDQHKGRVVKSTGDGLLAVFDMPTQGVKCGLELCEALRGIDIDIRAGIHAGEIELHDDGDISGVAVNLAARVEQHAADRELWASSTVRDLMLGGSTSFTDRGEHELKGIDGNWRLFSVTAA